MPIPNAGCSWSARTTAASGDSENVPSGCASIIRAAAWLNAHSRTHRSMVSVAAASSVVDRGRPARRMAA